MMKLPVILAFLYASVQLHAQEKMIDRTLELSIKEELPQLPAFPVINFGKPELKLQNQQKIVVLDFFDTYCSNCIASLPKMQALNNKLGNEIAIIMVTWQDRETIEKFFSTNPFTKEHKIKIPVIYSDTILRKYFPHTGVPHAAWIYKGRVQAITHSDFINEKNLITLHTNGYIKLPRKNDFFEASNTMDHYAIGSSTFSYYRDAIPPSSLSIQLDSSTKKIKSSFYNMDIFSAYSAVWARLRKPEFLLMKDRIVWEVKNPSRFKQPDGEGNPNQWIAENAVCYERYDSLLRSVEEQAEIVLADLNNYLGIEVFWDKRVKKCIVIRKNGEPLPADKRPQKGQHLGSASVLAFLMDYSGEYPVTIDESNYKEKMIMPAYSNLETLNRQLSCYGLEAVHAIREIDVLVFREKKRS